MCGSDVTPAAEQALAALLDDFRRALAPEHPEAVVIGPVDFGVPAAERVAARLASQ